MQSMSGVGIIEVGIGEFRIGEGETMLVTCNLGSCVGVTLYSPTAKTGALLHIKLPVCPDLTQDCFNLSYEPGWQRPGAYADTAIPAVLDELEKKGICAGNLEATIAGGARMFPVTDATMDVGENNVRVVKSILEQYRIPVTGEDTGGESGRTMMLDVRNGDVMIYFFSKETNGCPPKHPS